MMDKKAFIHRYTSDVIYMDIQDKPIKPSCSNCKHHTWDWYTNDEDYGDEFEVCLKNNDLNGPCKDYEEM